MAGKEQVSRAVTEPPAKPDELLGLTVRMCTGVGLIRSGFKNQPKPKHERMCGGAPAVVHMLPVWVRGV